MMDSRCVRKIPLAMAMVELEFFKVNLYPQFEGKGQKLPASLLENIARFVT